MMVSSINRRQFERLMLSDDVIAIDETGRELGKVSETSGGGMMISVHSQEVVNSLPIGKKLQVTVKEPQSKTSNTIDIIVRHHEGAKIGVEFVTGKSKA